TVDHGRPSEDRVPLEQVLALDQHDVVASERLEGVRAAVVPGVQQLAGTPYEIHDASIKKAGRGDRDREEQGSRPSRPAQARKSLRQGGCLLPLSGIAKPIFSPLPVEFRLNRSVDP